MDWNKKYPSFVGRAAVASALCVMLSGCGAIGVALIGAGATAGASHHMGGINYRTFTQPLPKVETATQAALKRMGVTIDSTERLENVTVIKASTQARSIEVQLEILTPQTTRMRSVAYQTGGILVDASTGGEIINQTELALALSGRPSTPAEKSPVKPVAKRNI